MRKTLTTAFLTFAAVLALAVPTFAQTPGPKAVGGVDVAPPAERADAATNTQHSHSTGATITLTAGPTGGAQGTVYLTGLDISVCENGTGAAAAAPLYITTTGFNGNPQYQVAGGTNNAAMLGWCSPTQTIAFSAPLKAATDGTSPTFVLPTFGSGETVSVNVYYRLGYK